MRSDAHLPNNVEELQALLLAQIASTETLQNQCDAFRAERDTYRHERDLIQQSSQSRDAEIARLNLLIDKLKRMLFGRKSEKLAHQIDQLELELEELYIARAVSEGSLPVPPQAAARAI